MANKTLTARVRFETKQAEQALTRLQKKINTINTSLNKRVGKNGLDTQISKARIQQEKLNQSILKTRLAEQKLTEQKHRTSMAAQKLKDTVDRTTSSANNLLGSIKKIAQTYLGMKGLEIVIKASDTVTSTKNMLNNLEGGNAELTAETMDKVYAASQRSRSDYSGMLKNVAKTMTLAPDAFQGNIDNAIRFQEIMSKSYAVGGASAQEMHTSMYQMVQALGSGRLNGDELRSVREGAPLAYKAIEKYAQGVLAAAEAEQGLEKGALGSSESLKDLAADGKITSDMVVAAIMNAGDTIEDKFKNTDRTFAQVWTSIKNTGMKAFQPALESLNALLNSPAIQGLITVIAKVLTIIGSVISWVVGGIISVINWCADNWDWLGKVILIVLLSVGAIMAVILFPKFIAWLSYLAFAISYYAVLGAQALASGIKAMIGWMMANWAMLLIIIVLIAIIATVVLLADSFEDALGMIVGGIMTAVAFVWNLIVGVIDAIIQFLWTYFVEPFIGIIEWILNVCNGGFDSFGGAVANLIGQVISWFLSLGKVVTKIIDAIFGTDWTAGLKSLQDKVLAWGKKEDTAITLSREAPSLKNIGVDRWAYGDAYNTGYKWGSDLGTGIKNTLSGLTSLPDPNGAEYSVDGAYDDSKLLQNIDSNVDDMNMKDDDLDYLRKLAEMEWRNEFTTAEIKVEMTNHNTVNGEQDLDGIVSYLSDTLREEMYNTAYAVHL